MPPNTSSDVNRDGRVTIAQVAALADTSTATVSRALNGDRRVSAELAERVRSAAEQLGYAPNAAARLLRRRHTRLLALLVSDLSILPLSQWVRAAEERAHELGYDVLVADARANPAAIDRAVEYLLGQPLEGVIVAGALPLRPEHIDILAKRHIPIVPSLILNPDRLTVERRTTEHDGIVDALTYLATTGHTRIAMLNSVWRDEPLNPNFNPRTQAVVDVADSVGIETVVLGDAPVRGVTPAAKLRKLTRGNGYLAAITLIHSDVPWTLRTLTEAGLRVPRDLSLIVFGDSEWVQSWDPPISVLARDMRAEAWRYIDLIVDCIERGAVPDDDAALWDPLKFVLRASTPDRRPDKP